MIRLIEKIFETTKTRTIKSKKRIKTINKKVQC